MARKRNTSDDIAFDPDGQPVAIGTEAGDMQDLIVEHPDSKPVMLVAVHQEMGIGVRVFGPPMEDVADILDQVALMYRKAVDASKATRQ